MFHILIWGAGSIILFLVGYCFYSFVKLIENPTIKLIIAGIPVTAGIIFRIMAINIPSLPRNRDNIVITLEAIRLDNLCYIFTMLSGILIPVGIILFVMLLFTFPPKEGKVK